MTAVSQPLPMTRREFLYYVWGASMALLMAESVGATLWFTLPRFREGEFGGLFPLEVTAIPEVDSKPKGIPDGRFWLVNVGDKRINDPRFAQVGTEKFRPKNKGLKVIYMVCVHLGCLYGWGDASDRFECPCHGSKYLADGTTYSNPANRNLDTFEFEFQDAAGNTLAKSEPDADGNIQPVEIPSGATTIVVNTGKRFNGQSNDPGKNN
ncbi:MAG TPA: Rieske 2Fe-2S domain-containing protein [Anaerolineales bacterium]|nr:Rieske 2Fe-2S domain-containing protein [Anaerolineales bacterium]